MRGKQRTSSPVARCIVRPDCKKVTSDLATGSSANGRSQICEYSKVLLQKGFKASLTFCW